MLQHIMRKTTSLCGKRLTVMFTSFKVVVFDYLFGVINNRRKVNL